MKASENENRSIREGCSVQHFLWNRVPEAAMAGLDGSSEILLFSNVHMWVAKSTKARRQYGAKHERSDNGQAVR